ncbi:MAG: NUDIX domain-containing protein [Ruminococcaceae bacterium]|nr:NUDIX domain-containing protein [Oscillospiraceae bacterium]
MKLVDQLKSFVPFDEKERADLSAFLDFIKNNENCLSRENTAGHITASAWIVNEDKSRVLFCYHNIYDSWSWVGGHADGEEELLSVALREAKEETGADVRPLSEDIFSLEILPVAGHMKKGKYVPSHIHYNVTYLVTADEKERLSVCEDENSAVAWIDINEISEKSSEKWMVENIYNKLIEKMRALP